MRVRPPRLRLKPQTRQYSNSAARNNAKTKSSSTPKFDISPATGQLLLIGGVVGWGIVAGLSIRSQLEEETWYEGLKHSWFTAKPTPNVTKAISMLKSVFPEQGRLLTDAKVLTSDAATQFLAYIGSEAALPHKAIVFPQSTEDVVKIVKICKSCNVSIVPRGSGTGLEGHASGTTGDTICIDLSQMDRIIHINVADSDLTCQAGATWDGVNEILRKKGIPLFFPLDPASGSSLGGNLSTSCSGPNAVRYGTARGEWFLSATVVLASGEVIKTRRRAHKSSAGFDLTQLFIGAEGTLGIVTEVTIKLAPALPTTVALAHFPNVDFACRAVDALLKSHSGMHIQCVELTDSTFMKALNHSLSQSVTDRATRYPVSDTLFIKIQGSSIMQNDTLADIQRTLAQYGCEDIRVARGEEEADAMWGHRRGALPAILGYIEGSQVWSTDVCVPVSNLASLVRQVQEDAAKAGIICPIVGHVGDGNFHAALIYRNPAEFSKVKELSRRIVERALELDGTCTGEHGVGVGKRQYLIPELGTGTVELMKVIKKRLDPTNMMNPGKLYPSD